MTHYLGEEELTQKQTLFGESLGVFFFFSSFPLFAFGVYEYFAVYVFVSD